MNPLLRPTFPPVVAAKEPVWVGRLFRSLHAEVAKAIGVCATGLPRLIPELNQIARKEFELSLEKPANLMRLYEVCEKADSFAKSFASKVSGKPQIFLTPLRDRLVKDTPDECRRAWGAFFAGFDKWGRRALIKNQRIFEVTLVIVIVLMHDPDVHKHVNAVDAIEAVYNTVQKMFNIPPSDTWQAIRTVRRLLRIMADAGDIVALAALETITERHPRARKPLPPDAPIFQGIIE